MEQAKLDRINELAHKNKTVGLTDEELAERAILREEFLAEIRADVRSSLDNVDFVDENGKVIPAKGKH